MKRVARSAIVERGAEAMYDLVLDVEAYPGFLPWCAAAQVRERSPGHSVATLVLGARGLRQSLTTENTLVPGRSIDMRLVEGPFRKFTAQWRFTPLGEGAARIEFAVQYEFSSRVAAALLEPIFARIADSTVEAFCRRARSDAGD
jgi:ribosome-associated toxin RatA of RatAB toxin-antitoxin module